MSYGEKLTQLRKQAGMTQAELGNRLNVTYQAVSKWERDESEPDFATMSKIAKIFGVSLSYFDDGGEQAATADVAVQPAAGLADEKRLIGTCTGCGRVIYEGEEEHGEGGKLLCRECAAKVRRAAEESRQKERAQRLAKADKLRKRKNRGFIWGTIVTVILFILMIVGICLVTEGRIYVAVGGAIAVVLSFFTVSQLFWDGIVAEVALFGGKIVGTPGVIFSFDLDGKIFLVAMKILFALLRIAIFILTFALSFMAGAIMSPFTFIPCLRRVNNEIQQAETGVK